MSKGLLADVVEVVAVLKATVYRIHWLRTSTMQGVLHPGPQVSGSYAMTDLTRIWSALL